MRIKWTKPALGQLHGIVGYIAQDNPAAADELLAEIVRTVDRLTRFPFMGRAGPAPDTRELIIRRNHLVTYRVWRDDIEVLNLWHGAQARGKHYPMRKT